MTDKDKSLDIDYSDIPEITDEEFKKSHIDINHWNYRVIEHHDEENEKYYQIHEVYYDRNNKVVLYGENPSHPIGETKKELQGDIENMLYSCKRPFLKQEDLPG